jgi:aminopeptidase N
MRIPRARSFWPRVAVLLGWLMMRAGPLAAGSPERTDALSVVEPGAPRPTMSAGRDAANPTAGDFSGYRWKVEHATESVISGGPVPPAPPDPPTDYDAEHYAIRIDVQFDTQTIAGEVDLRARSLVAQFTQMEVDLRQNMAVSSVHRGPVPLTFSRSNDRIHITLDRAFAEGETLTVTIAYSGSPLSEGFGCFRFATHDGRPVASTLSEPWFARNWWPCKEDPADKATADLTFTVPVSMTVVSNGTLVSNVAHGSRRTFRWRSEYPIATYLVCMAATDYVRFDDTYVGALGDSMPVEFYAYPEDEQTCRARWEGEVEKLEFFRGVFGEYPFIADKYGIVEQIRGGIEHQTITGLPPDGLGDSVLLSHELSHQWWGDMVTCATWHDIWLNEGFATYASGLWLEHESPGGYAAFMNDIEDAARSAGPVYRTRIDTLEDIFNAATYERAAWILHMLRGVMSDSTFFGALRDYRAAFEFASATTADYESIVETRAGRSLSWFFDEWIYGAGEPVYEYSWQAIAPDRVLVHVEQVQAGPTFRMPIPITVSTMLGFRPFVLEDSLRSQTFDLRPGGGIAGMQFDPRNWILETHREVSFPADLESPSAASADAFRIEIGPSPTRGETQITLGLPAGPERRVRVVMHDVTGRLRAVVADRVFPAGRHTLVWNRPLARGVYFVDASGPAVGRAAPARLVVE